MKIKIKNHELEIIDKAVFIDSEILVVGDLHIGYEDALNQKGILLPRQQFVSLKEDFEKIFKLIEESGRKVKELIILGDLKHEFGKISGQEWQEVFEILSYLERKIGKIILVRGNHDIILDPIIRKKKIKIKDFYIWKDVCFFHGHRLFKECLDKDVSLLVLGHKHPAITIREDVKAESYKCFLVGSYKKKDCVIIPSFFPLTEGSDITIENTNLGIDLELDNFRVFVLGDKIYDFGKVKDVEGLV